MAKFKSLSRNNCLGINVFSVYGMIEQDFILFEFIGTIKSENVMINKVIHSCLGNFEMPKPTCFCIATNIGKGGYV